jgi:outer membrane protein OmpA-like peptidoglycan-associated protein
MGKTTHKNNAANLKWKNDKSFIDFLKKYPNVQVEIAGHTDSDADKKHNQKLSQNRAEKIKRYMISKGIEPKRISTIGYGETVPKYPNDSPENKALNRRIEAKIVGN